MVKSPLAGVIVDRSADMVISKVVTKGATLGPVYFVHKVTRQEGNIPLGVAFVSRHATLTAARLAAGIERNTAKAA